MIALSPHPNPQRRIGLTGGIATGKTTVSDYLGRVYHFPILDADLYAREAVALGSPILEQIVDRYGAKVLREDGTLDRSSLGNIIFLDPLERQWLEKQIHPYVRDRLLANLALLDVPVAILAIPLLFEAQMLDLVNEIWVVFCPEQEQLRRLQERDHLTLTQAKARITSQFPLTQKMAAADVILDNTGTLPQLWQQIDAALQ